MRKPLYDLVPVPGAPVEVGVGDAGLGQPGPDPAEEGGELAEDQRLVALPDDLGQVGQQHLHLRRRHAGVRLVQQGRVQAQPAEQGQGAQHGEAVPLQVVDQAQHLLPLPLQMGLVEPLVSRMQLDLDHLLLLGRQLGRDAVLGPPQQERSDASAELVQAGRIPVPLDRSAVVLGEPVGAAGTGPGR